MFLTASRFIVAVSLGAIKIFLTSKLVLILKNIAFLVNLILITKICVAISKFKQLLLIQGCGCLATFF